MASTATMNVKAQQLNQNALDAYAALATPKAARGALLTNVSDGQDAYDAAKAISDPLDATVVSTTAAWVAVGSPGSGAEFDAKEAAIAAAVTPDANTAAALVDLNDAIAALAANTTEINGGVDAIARAAGQMFVLGLQKCDREDESHAVNPRLAIAFEAGAVAILSIIRV